MLSRVADSLYWMSRNIERTELNARILDVHLTQMVETSSEEMLDEKQWQLLFGICSTEEELEALENNPNVQDQDYLHYLAFHSDNLNSVFNCVRVARENVRISRDHLPNELFEIWNDLYHFTLHAERENFSIQHLRAFLQKVKMTTLIAQGIIESGMSRGVSYRMIKIGKWLERAEKTARILNVVCEQTRETQLKYKGEDYYAWLSALRMLNGYEAFLKVNRPKMDPKTILTFLITDESFPRSIHYNINHVRAAVDNLENAKIAHYSFELYYALENLKKNFDEMSIHKLNSDDMLAFLNRFQNQCNDIGKIFSKTYYLTEPETQQEQTQLPTVQEPPKSLISSSMKYKIEHTNVFEYDTWVDQSMNSIRLTPRTDECQRLLSFRTDITPVALTKGHVDIWGNSVESFFIADHHKHLEVKATSVVSIQKSPWIHRINFSPEMYAIFHSSLFKSHYLAYLSNTAYTYLTPEQMLQVDSEIGEMYNPVQYSIDVMSYLHKRFTYDGSSTDVSTKAKDSFNLNKGVCQDISHVMLGILRTKHIPSRYVSGYLYVGENSALIGDSASHAWVEVMVPGIGWVGLDPTNNVEALENHIRLGVGRDYGDVSPVQGVYRGGSHKLDVKVSVSVIE
ncbi:alpha-E domain-containing protein [Paenisporosarcina antarctica]|uniref:Protein containing transglutaminase-like domain, cysteine protease n=1 Tax=Paenisporosarcina antarctica TaxID=417367 RepID=A0A4P7A0W2_9BACL|nr:alpha-E domain-containing protein [Paenisporosarcina antarctica]QBP42293.1 protein containing transglutaminase-like domain, cysteine protease [Paenisporosarcina antarctica]